MTKKHEPTTQTRARVKRLAALGVHQEDIASALKISKNTLLAHYKEECDEGRIGSNSAVAGYLFTQAKTNPAAAIFWLKTQARWKEQPTELKVEMDIKDPVDQFRKLFGKSHEQ